MSIGEHVLPQDATQDAAPSASLIVVLAELRAGLDIAARELDGFQETVLELVRRAGAGQDAGMMEDAQRIDPLVQRLHRLVAGAADIIAAVEAGGAADLDLALDANALRSLSQSATDAACREGDCDFF